MCLHLHLLCPPRPLPAAPSPPRPGPAVDLTLSLGPLRGPLPRPAPPQQSPVSAEREAVLLLLPLVVCLLNLGGPYLFRILAALERHDSPVLEVYVAICRCEASWARCGFLGRDFCLPGALPSAHAPTLFRRNLILKMVTLGILCYHWLGRRVGTLKDQVRVGRAVLVGAWGSPGPSQQPALA